MQERRVLVCRFGEDPNTVDVIGIKDTYIFKRICGVNHRLDNYVTLRIKSCEFPNATIDIDITNVQKKMAGLNGHEKPVTEYTGDIYICQKNYSTNTTKRRSNSERQKLAPTITFNAEALTPQQLLLQHYQSITFIQTTPIHTFENFFDYFKSEIDAYQEKISIKENETPTAFKTPLPIKRKTGIT